MVSLRKIQLISIFYSIGQITLIVALSIKSFYLRWWLNCLFPDGSDATCDWQNYYLALIVLDIVTLFLFWFSTKLLLSNLMCREVVLNKHSQRLTMMALIGQLMIYIIPLGVLWLSNIVDRLFELWMAWNTLNIGLCTATWYFMNIFLIKEDSGYRSVN